MFPKRFFAAVFFPPVYFGEVGSDPIGGGAGLRLMLLGAG